MNREPWWVWLGIAVVCIIFGWLLLATPARAAPHVPTGQACMYIADYALVARALAEDETITTAQADALLDRVYVIRAPVIVAAQDTVRAAARAESLRKAQRFSAELLASCMENSGDLGKFLGII